MNRDIEILNQDTFYDVTADTNTVIKKAYSPKIVDNIWYVYNDSTKEYESTGINAKGQKGDTGSQGIPGTNGTNGTNGADGYSPSATVSKTGNTATITITDKNGTTTTTVKDGETGATGQPGQNGTNGTDGKSLEYNWNGTKLGIKRDDETSYQYVDLKGEAGESYDDTEIRGLISNKQDTLVSGTNIKTINDESILGEGNIEISGGGDSGVKIYNFPDESNLGNDYIRLSNESTYNNIKNILNDFLKEDTKIAIVKDAPGMWQHIYTCNRIRMITTGSSSKIGQCYGVDIMLNVSRGNYDSTGGIGYYNYSAEGYYQAWVKKEEYENKEIIDVYSSSGGQKGNLYFRVADKFGYNFQNLNTFKKVMLKDNTTEFTPTSDYNPATKKYVDDKITALYEKLGITEE